MKFNHTKGHWTIENFKGKGAVIDIVLEDQPNMMAIAQVYSLKEMRFDEKQNVEHIANAKLIKHAPQLLETVVVLQRRLENLINATPSGDERDKLTEENIEALNLLHNISSVL